MKRVSVFIVATQYENIGDLLINKCLIDQLSINSIVYLDLKNVPDSFKFQLLEGTTNVFDLNTLTPYTFKNLSVIRLFFSSLGITHLFRSPGPYGNGKSFILLIKNIYLLFLFQMFKLKNVKSYFVGNEVKIEHWMDRITTNLLFIPESVFCRSNRNIDNLKSFNLKNVEYIPDLCFGYMKNIDYTEKVKKIGISFRNIGAGFNDNIINTIKNVLNAFPDYNFVFFYQVTPDKDFVTELYAQYKDFNNTIFLCECLKWDNINIYEEFEFVVSNRLHVLLLGLIHQAIPIACINSDIKTLKISEIFDTIGLGELVSDYFDIQDITRLRLEKEDMYRKVEIIKADQFSIVKDVFRNVIYK